MKTFWLCFVPLFVAVDALGVMPIFISIVQGLEVKRIRKIVIQSVITAMAVALLFLFVGEALLRLLGITVADFLVAGGIVLFLISINDLLNVEKPVRHVDPEDLGPVPIGVPLIVGPAVLTTIMLLVREYGFVPTALAAVSNIFIGGLLFAFSNIIMKVLGSAGTKIASKIANLLLASIAVMMVRKGIYIFISH